MTNLLSELWGGGEYTDNQGYWKIRGHETDPGYENLPLADFFEDLSSGSHKKNWLDIEGRFKVEKNGKSRMNFHGNLEDLYVGTQLTAQVVIPGGFFMYSASVVLLHLALAEASREFGCSPDVKAVKAQADPETVKYVSDLALATRVIAFGVYENSGSLGGYSPGVWPLWGRLSGNPCPTDYSVLSPVEAKQASSDYYYASEVEKEILFCVWWKDSDVYAKLNIADTVLRHIFRAYHIYKTYQAIEGGAEPDVSGETYAAAIISGFFRRSAKGRLTNAFSDPESKPLASYLDEAYEELENLLTGCDDLLTPFGKAFMDTLEITLHRVDIRDGILDREKQGESDHNKALAKLGYLTRVRRRNRL